MEAPSNKLLTTAFEVSLESVAITRRLSVDSKIAGIAIEHRNLKVPEGRQSGQGGRQYMHLSLWWDFACLCGVVEIIHVSILRVWPSNFDGMKLFLIGGMEDLNFNYCYKITYESGETYDRRRNELSVEISKEDYKKIITGVLQERPIDQIEGISDVIDKMTENVE